MNKNTNHMGGMTMGIATITVIFVILGLTIFAVLSLSTASQEKKLAEKYADSVTRYWAADEACTQVALQFRDLWTQGADRDALSRLAAQLNAGFSLQGDRAIVSYQQSINEYSHISVRLGLGETFDILEWKTVAEGQWLPEDTLGLWQGES